MYQISDGAPKVTVSIYTQGYSLRISFIDYYFMAVLYFKSREQTNLNTATIDQLLTENKAWAEVGYTFIKKQIEILLKYDKRILSRIVRWLV